ncbi:alpha/beta fold hydrolase [Alteromonas sp. 1_MG-2023]|uniref:alpha/beta fold hydrolase n=1 Tax=Alteromonas sp. 1_MG-2023 TaxID=3062669 RepID=UPI0026E3E4E0|nr:alpha/beta fold hydrolase [Alteromonas sp. 1_MG-2023]MDO6568051.1 alpha/beta fold hydrolase [Alteromonas sp. 1_MG-2023]
MSLHFKLSEAQKNSPWLVLVHGLFGSADNLAGIKRHFENSFNIISVDLPDHGLSPWTAGFTLEKAVNGIIEILDDNKVEEAAFLGHSLGGKVVMQLALSFPKRVTQLIVADIAPVKYEHSHQAVFDGLKNVPLNTINDRKQAQSALSEFVKEPGVQQFLLKSLYQNDNGEWQWRFNVDGLIASYSQIIDWPQSNLTYDGVTLFIKGAESDYITSAYRQEIAKYFPHAKAHIIEGTGHWLHAEKPSIFNGIVARTLEKSL